MQQITLFYLLSVLFATGTLLGQSTKDLYTIPGLTFYNEVTDDTGCISPSSFTYVRDTIVEDKLVSVFEGFSLYGPNIYFLHFDNQQVFIYDEGKINSSPQFEKVFDFGLLLGDTIELNMHIFEVVERDTIKLQDDRDRISLFLRSSTLSTLQFEWIEGIGYSNRGTFFNEYNRSVEVKCVSTENDPIYFNGITEDQCRSLSCRRAKARFDFQDFGDNVEIRNTSEKLVEQEWDFGDGSSSSEPSPDHQYTEFGCYTIHLTGRDTCGNVFNAVHNHNYCVDSNWVNIQMDYSPERAFTKIDYLTTESALAITTDSMYQTHNGGKTWESLATNFTLSGDTVSYRDLNMYNEDIGLMYGFVNRVAKILRTTDGGLTWTETLPAASSAQIWTGDNYFLIYLPFANLIYISNDQGASWIEKEVPYFNIYCDLQVVNDKILAVGYNRGSICQLNYAIFATSTIDATSDWTTQNLMLNSSFRNSTIEFVDEDTGFISLTNKLLKTENGGDNWEEVSLPRVSRVDNVVFLNESVGWLAGQLVLHTTDGGETWENDYCQFEGSVKSGSLQIIEENLYCDIRDYGLFQRAPEDFFECETNSTSNYFNLVETKIFPNPSTDIFVIDPDIYSGVAEVITQDGYLVFKQTFHRDQFEIDLSDQPSGIYFLRIIGEQNIESIDRIIVIE